MAMNLWSSSGSPHQPDLLPLIMQILSERGIEHMRAPYSAWGQLAYLQAHPRQLVNAIFGGSELLMYDLDKVVVDLDLDKGTYSWINKKGVLTDLQVTDDQFLDVCIFAGFENCSTFPPLNDPASFTFKGIFVCFQHVNFLLDLQPGMCHLIFLAFLIISSRHP